VIGDEEAPKGGEVVDLMEALKRSLGGDSAAKGRTSKAKAEPEKRETKSAGGSDGERKAKAPRKRASKAA